LAISFDHKDKVPVNRATDLLESKAPARLIDLRTPEKFRDSFIPGSYNVPDAGCWEAAQGSGLFNGREIYFLADDPAQLSLCEEFGDLGAGSELAGWFGADALEEWRKAIAEMGHLEAITADTLTIRLASWNTILLEIVERSALPAPLTHPAALRFCLDELPLSLDGLPVETAICVMARSPGLTSFAASLLWNFGFHQISYVAAD
jgi:hypothetical protein